MQKREELSVKGQREPTVEEIAKAMDRSKEDIVIAMESIVDPVSLYEPVYSDGSDTMFVMDQIGDKQGEESWLDEMLLRESMEKLSDREKKILNMRFMMGKTQTEVAQEVGISQAQVSRLEKCAIKRVKEHR
jgi:RNA polymerase sporulation-specific sigma factor